RFCLLLDLGALDLAHHIEAAPAAARATDAELVRQSLGGRKLHRLRAHVAFDRAHQSGLGLHLGTPVDASGRNFVAWHLRPYGGGAIVDAANERGCGRKMRLWRSLAECREGAIFALR